MQAIWQSKYLRILTLLLLVQATLFYTASHGDSRPLTHPLAEFPQILPGYQMVRQGVVDDETMAVLKADDAIDRFYARTPMPDLNHLTREQRDALFATTNDFFLAYFSTQQQGQSPHSPKNCLPGNGWQPVDTGEITIPIPGLGSAIRVNKYVVSKGENQDVVLYWFQSHGRVVANEFASKYYLIADSLRYHRSDTAIVKVTAPVLDGDTARSLDGAIRFVQVVFPAVYRYLPM